MSISMSYIRLNFIKSIRNADILRQTVAMSERALRISDELLLANRHVYLLELGRQMLFQGKSKDAMKLFDAAYEAGEDKLDALIGRSSYFVLICNILFVNLLINI